MAYPDSLDPSNLADIGTVMVWLANVIKLVYYLTNNSFLFITDIVTYLPKWVGAIPGFVQTYMMLSNQFMDTDYDHKEFDRFINISKVSGWTLAAALWPIGLIFGDDGIPGIDNAAEANLDYWPGKFSPNFDTPMWTVWWLSNGGSMFKMIYKWQIAEESKTPMEQLSWWNEVDVAEVLGWNFVMGWWSQTFTYGLNIFLLQLPWAILLWFGLDGEFDALG